MICSPGSSDNPDLLGVGRAIYIFAHEKRQASLRQYLAEAWKIPPEEALIYLEYKGFQIVFSNQVPRRFFPNL